MTRLTLARHLIDLSKFLDPVESKISVSPNNRGLQKFELLLEPSVPKCYFVFFCQVSLSLKGQTPDLARFFKKVGFLRHNQLL